MSPSATNTSSQEQFGAAIIGIGCRLPGGANNPKAFWNLLKNGIDAITEVPENRWNSRVFYHPDSTKPGKSVTRWGGFIEQIDHFDARFFGISPREAVHIDPQQRMLLEVAWEALEDGGQVLEQLAGTEVGVFIGISTYDYGEIHHGMNDREYISPHTNTGGALSIAANRISYMFDFRGPSMAVDTACSSSLVAAHLALQSLRNGECSLALIGGVNAILKPESTIGFSRASMLSPDGRCKAFDSRANGYTRSEGAGIVLVKPLQKALADGDPIYAVLRGSAVNQDGRTNGITVPSRRSQEAMLRDAYHQAGVAPAQVRYVEAHGTGTPVGDPIETQALGTVLRTGRADNDYCVIGSVKTNIGHLEAGAGIAGLIKAAMVLKHREIPPNLHFKEANPDIPLEELKLRVPQAVEPLPDGDGPAYAGVNSFGFGGTNAHIVLEEPPQAQAVKPVSEVPSADKEFLLPLSARSPEALQALAQAYRKYLPVEGPGANMPVRDLCYSASIRRSHHDYRLALVGRSPEEFAALLDAYLAGETRPGLASGRPSSERRPQLVFVFSGMGPQWWAMGRQLFEQEPVFREAVEECDELFRQLAGWSILDEMMADEAHSRIAETEVAQPANFVLQVGLDALWRSWGIEPDAIVGHSAGEVAAVYAAGALSLSEAVRVIYHRSRLQQRTSGEGTLAAVGLSSEAAEHLLEGYSGRVSIAAINSPNAVTLSGDADALAEIVQSLEQQKIFCRFLRVAVPYHSHYMEAIKDELYQSLQDLETHPTTTPLYSTVTGTVVEGRELDADYWWRNVRKPVLFAAAVDQLIQEGNNLFLELSPHPVLAGSISECLMQRRQKGTILASLRRQEAERAMMLSSLGALYTLGSPVGWSNFYPEGGRFVSLPSYPWQWERYWMESHTSEQSRLARPVHPLLGNRLESAQPVWEQDLDTYLLPFIDDHRIQGSVVYPGAAYVEMALAVGKEMFGDGPRELEEVEFQKALFLPDGTSTQLQFAYDPETTHFRIYSRPKDQERSWIRHAVGKVQKIQKNGAGSSKRISLDDIRSRCPKDITTISYPKLRGFGLELGPSFQGVTRLWQGEREALGQIQPPEVISGDVQDYQIHPAVLDACFQVLLGTVIDEDNSKGNNNVYLPVKIERLRLYNRPGSQMWSHARLNERDKDGLEGDVWLYDAAGELLLEIQGFRCQAVEKAPGELPLKLDEWLYEFQWQPVQLNDQMEAVLQLNQNQSNWLIFADSAIGGQLADLLAAYGQFPVLVSPGESYHRLKENHFQVHPERREDFQMLLEAVGSEHAPCRGVLYLWSLDTPDSQAITVTELESAQLNGCVSILYLVQAMAKLNWTDNMLLWMVTRGVQAVGLEKEALTVAQSPVWGLGRVIANEYPGLRCKMLDLGSTVTAIEIGALFNELLLNDQEEEVAYRDGVRYVHRLNHVSLGETDPEGEEKVKAAEHQPFYLENSKPGLLDNLTLRETARQEPGPGEVEIQVLAAGLNFMDIMKAMGLYPADDIQETLWLGSECAGKIVAVGEGVTNFKVGDEVIAFAAGCFSAYVKTDANLVAPKPSRLTFEEAATIPLVFLTVYYSLHHLGRMRAGERVLIHSASGGVGLAAIQYAQMIGAEVFATAGNPEKREYIRSLGVEYVMDSRSLAFAEEIMAYTDGQGVDIVLNSLAGDAIPKSISVLGAYGRFLEIGKRDIYQNSKLGLRPFRNNLSYFAIDVSRLCLKRPELAGELFRELVQLFEDGRLQPLPNRVFPISQSVDAFRYMAQAKHIGKIILTMDDPEVWIVPAAREELPIHSDGTYLITGGLGGFGLEVAQWMVEKGARYLVLMGRSGAPAETKPVLEKMKQAGVRVVVAKGDIAQEKQLKNILASVKRSLPPVRGVVHAAAVFDDGYLFQLDRERFEAVMKPKVSGAWNLHTQTLDQPLDFFVLFSSIAALVGNPGQGNYAAANAFLDALAHYRRAQNLPALTISWGAIGEAGYLTRHSEIAEHFERQGLRAFTPGQTLAILEKLLEQNPVQVGVVNIDWQKWGRFSPQLSKSPRFSHLVQMSVQDQPGTDGQKGKKSILGALHSASEEEREQILVDRLSEQVARVLGTSASNLDTGRPLTEFGLDSIMAVELSHWIGDRLGVELSTMTLIQTPSIVQLAGQILAGLDLSTAKAETSEQAALVNA